jgi:hypothetical protein
MLRIVFFGERILPGVPAFLTKLKIDTQEARVIIPLIDG